MDVRPHRTRDQRGAAAIEFALVLLPFFLLVFGAVDFGWAINKDVLINNAAREGAREGSLNPNAAAIAAVVRSSLPTEDAAAATVSVTCRKASGAACSSIAAAVPGDTVVVRVSLAHSWITPVGEMVDPGGTTLTKRAEMRIE
jgi:Flp pilus assembly protein TadG